MQGDAKVIEYLNGALKRELTAINQYFLHARMLEDWGLDKIGGKIYEESIDEMKHADRLIKRILFLEGLPNLQDLGKLLIAENVWEVLVNDLELEVEGVAYYREAVKHCESVQDYHTRDLFAELIADEEGHIDFLETQKGLYEQVGKENYFQYWIS
ncbi:MAG: bacterioferritin [Halofilum sp. (in: g-proteobacteria)]|jgi:bacterioferritin